MRKHNKQQKKQKQPKRELDQFDLEAEAEGAAIKLAFRPKTPTGKKVPKIKEDLRSKAIPLKPVVKAKPVGEPWKVIRGIGGWPIENMRQNFE